MRMQLIEHKKSWIGKRSLAVRLESRVHTRRLIGALKRRIPGGIEGGCGRIRENEVFASEIPGAI